MYRAPAAEISHTLKRLTGLGEALANGTAGDLSEDLLDAILEEGARFATDEVAPLAKIGDEQGARLKDGAVTMPDGWKKLYTDWCAGGWNALTGPEEFGGQGLPMSLAVAAYEMWNGGSLAFGVGPTLTTGAIEAIHAHASDELKAKYLPKIVSGEWTGTMNLTEPQAGSDLNALKTRAEPCLDENGGADGTYRIFGQKIYITYGEHDLTENIVHLVLARLPDAPAGQRGISLFLVPKFHVGDDGALGARNDLFCSGLEHKLGIHASPTCTMIYGDGKHGDTPGAIGWLVGEENRGLACMFTMMNNARLLVAVQGVAVADAATQKAQAYANERKQGRAEGYKGEGMAPIVLHPDVQRNLLTMRALTNAARAIVYNCAHAIDRAGEAGMVSARGAAAGAESGTDDGAAWTARAGLLTPIAKAFATDIGCEVASLGVQVHGGMGFVEETGAARLMRDARIAPIYEGTNGIQAIDLVTRKLPLNDGDSVRSLIADLRGMADEVAKSNRSDLTGVAERLDAALADLTDTTEWLLDTLKAGGKSEALAGATPYLRLFGLAAGGTWLAKSALETEPDLAAERAGVARFAAHNLLAETAALKATVTQGGGSLLEAGALLAAE